MRDAPTLRVLVALADNRREFVGAATISELARVGRATGIMILLDLIDGGVIERRTERGCPHASPPIRAVYRLTPRGLFVVRRVFREWQTSRRGGPGAWGRGWWLPRIGRRGIVPVVFEALGPVFTLALFCALLALFLRRMS